MGERTDSELLTLAYILTCPPYALCYTSINKASSLWLRR